MKGCGYDPWGLRCRLAKGVRLVVFALLLSIACYPYATVAAPLKIGDDATLPLGSESGLPDGPSRNVTVVSIPYFSFMELDPVRLEAYPAFRELGMSGDWAAMNVRLPYKGLESVYATWGAGQFVDARGTEVWSGSEHREGQSAAAMLKRYTGYSADDKFQAAVIPSIESIRQRWAAGGGEAVPGQLGQRLKAQGVRISVWSGLDTPGSGKDRIRRPAPLMAMDEQGTVEHGVIGGGILDADGSMPFGVVTRYGQIFDQWKRERQRAKTDTFAVIELGDLYRLYEEKEHYSAETFADMKQKIIGRMDRFLADLMNEMKAGGEGGVLWVLSPQVHSEAMRDKLMLTPAVRWQPALSAAGGLLSSATTQRPGIITATDVAPTMLREFGLSIPPSMTGMPAVDGRTMVRNGAGTALEWLLQDVGHKAKIYKLRPPLLYGLVVFEVVAMLLGLIVVWRNGRSPVRLYAVTRGLLFGVLLLPSVLLVMGWMVRWNTAGLIAFLFTVLIPGGTVASLYTTTMVRTIRAFRWIGSGLALLLLFDGMTGAQAMKYSVLGYDVMIGARYYGIGNEFMGVLLGAAVLGLSAGLQARAERAGAQLPRWRALAPAAAAGVAIAGYLSAPALGTNAGGALAAAAAFGVLTARLIVGGALCGRRLALALALPMAAALAGLWLLNAAWTPGTAGGPGSAAAAAIAAAEVSPGGSAAHGHGSHIGRAFETLRQGRYDAIGAMIARKLAMNLHLIRVSAWSKVLLTGLAVMAVLVLRPKGRLRRWGERYPYLMHGFYAHIIGVFAALALNDSGIVAAAAMIVYSSVPLLMLRLAEAEQSH